MKEDLTQKEEIAPGVLSLAAWRKRLYSSAVDADWNGNIEEAKRIFREIEDVDRRLAAGELYEPRF